MPRVRLPNASLNAGPDFPILPFLAPRLSTGSIAPRKRGIQHGRSNASYSRAEETVRTCDSGLNARHSKPPASVPDQHDTHTSRSGCSQPKNTTPARPQCHTSQHPSRAPLRPKSLHRIYADIFAITRQQHRSYATDEGSATKATKPQQPPHNTLPKKSKLERRADRRANGMKAERAKALKRETGRLRGFLARCPSYTDQQLLDRGQYRSLCRRVFNIEQWDLQELDLNADRHHGDWLIQAFAALDRRLFPEIQEITREIRLIHRQECGDWCANLLAGLDEEGDARMWKNWVGNDPLVRRESWEPLLLYLLDCKPSRALRFMQVLVEDHRIRSDIDPTVLADGLGYLSRLHLKGQYDTDPDWNEDLVTNQLEFAPGFYLIYTRILTRKTSFLAQDLIYNISQFAEIEDFKKIYELLSKEETRFSYDTLLHYANVFAEAGEVDYALRCLDKISVGWRGEGVWEQVVDRQRLRWTCALILRKTASQESGYRATPGLVESFITMGVKMDLTLYNVVIHNAMEAGDYTTAFKLFNSLQEHDLKPDEHTLGILLHGCIMQDNPGMFSDFARHVRNIAMETQDKWLASEYLCYLYIRYHDVQDTEEFTNGLWREYLEIFTATALEPLISLQRHQLRDRIAAPALEEGVTLMDPSLMALYIMLQVEIKYAMSLGHYSMKTLYDQFKILALQNTHPVLTELAANPRIWNAFLLAFCRKEHFASASQVIKDMTDASPQPNIYSWNIFMQAFFRTGQVQAAERVFEIMRSRGIDPDQYTHGVLLRGYAKAQLVDQIGQAMQHLDAEHELDPELLQALSRVVDREKMVRVLEESRLAKAARIQQQAEKEAQEREKRWTVPEYIDSEDEAAALREVEGVIGEEETEKDIGIMEEQAQQLKGQFVDPNAVSEPEPEQEQEQKTVLNIRRIRTDNGNNPSYKGESEDWF